VLDGTKTPLCQLCVRRVCLLKPIIILCKTSACKCGTGNSGTNRKVGKMAHWCYFFLNSKPKPSTPSPQPLNPNPHFLTQTPIPQTSEPQVQTQNPHLKPLFQTSNPNPILKTCAIFTYFSICAIITCAISTEHLYLQYINWRRFQITLHCWIVNQLNKIFL